MIFPDLGEKKKHFCNANNVLDVARKINTQIRQKRGVNAKITLFQKHPELGPAQFYGAYIWSMQMHV